MKTVRLINNVVHEIFDETIEELTTKFHPDIIAACVEVEADDVSHGWIYDPEENTIESPDDEVDLPTLKSDKKSAAFAYMSQMLEDATIYVDLESRTNTPFGCDAFSRENIIGMNMGISLGVPIANPRMWTPKGSREPISVTHAEFAQIGAAILKKKDELYQTYFFHKTMINSLKTAEEIQAYDFTEGY